MNPPPRLKVYGLLRLSRRAYLIVQITGLLIIVAIIAVGLCLPRPEVPEGVKVPPFPAALLMVLDLLPWLGLIALVYEVFETYIVLRKFRKLEAAGTPAAPLASPPAP